MQKIPRGTLQTPSATCFESPCIGIRIIIIIVIVIVIQSLNGFFGAVFITWLGHCHIDVRILGLVFFATDEDIGLLMGLEYSHGLPCK
jgi:hypothetical protein